MTLKQMSTNNFVAPVGGLIPVEPIFKRFASLPGQLALASILFAALPVQAALPELGPMPSLPVPLPSDSVSMGDAQSAPVVHLGLPITAGPFKPDLGIDRKAVPGNAGVAA